MATQPLVHSPAAGSGDAEDQFRMLADSIPGICWFAGRDGRAYWMNRAGHAYFGPVAHDADPIGFVHPDDVARARQVYGEGLAHGVPVETTVRVRGRDGAFRPFLSRATPVRDAEGRILRWCGVHVDLTERHAHDRRQAFLRAFHDQTRGLADADAILAVLSTMLGEQLDVDLIAFGEANGGDERDTTLIRYARGRHLAPDMPFRLGAEYDALLAGSRAGRSLVVDDCDAPQAMPAGTSQPLAAGAAVRAGIRVPIVKDGRVVASLAALTHDPRHWTADEVELCEELAERVWTTVHRARAEAKLKERDSYQAFLIEWGDSLRRAAQPDDIMTDTLERLGRHLGVTRTTYSEADDARQVFTTRWDWCDGCPSLVGTRVAMADIGEATQREWLAGEIVRYDDVSADARATAADRAAYARRGIRAFVSIPLIRHGQVRSILSVQSREPRRWRNAELALIRDMGERTWVALERARAQAELLERERNQAFLLDWNDSMRRGPTPRAMLETTLAKLGAFMGVSRAGYGEFEGDGEAEHLHVLHEWKNGVVEIIGQRMPIDALGRPLIDWYREGRILVASDLHDSPLIAADVAAFYDTIGIRASITVPTFKEGRLHGVVSLHQDAPREWTETEVRLVREVADRVRDVLERARSEQRLAESEALLAAFMENAPLGMHLKDADGRFLRLNPELARQMGVSPSTAVGRRPTELVSAGPAGRITELERRARAGETASAEFELPDRTDHAALLAVEFPIGAGGVAVTGGFTLDITARKAAEAALATSREALYQTEKLSALGSLLAGVSHELNNPLSIVVAQAVMLERKGQGTELAERAFKIRKAADRCAKIVQTFLAMARHKRPERTAVDLNAVAAAALELAEYGLRADSIAVDAALAPDLPQIAADADQLHQIIVNLVVNAQQAMAGHDGERRLSLRTARGPEPQTVVLEVADTGPGIPEDLARRVFEPFYTTKPQGEGTGVGLSFSLGLAEAHGGRLALAPSAQGACFRLTLPIDADVALPRVAPAEQPASPSLARRALLVDDELEIAESLADFLALEGFECEIVGGGQAASEALAGGEYDLIVSDLRMPGMNGPELHAWLRRQRPELADRLGFVTGDTLGLSVAQFLDEAKRPVLEKPFTPDAVQAFLRQFGS